jgi:hypothetical protein
MKPIERYTGIEGLNQLTFGELRSSDKLIKALTGKFSSLDANRLQDQLVETRVRQFVSVIRDTVADRYSALSILAFAHILVALDHFLQVMDEKPDVHPGGYADDLKHLEEVAQKFDAELDRYRSWKAGQPKDADWT